MNRIVRKNGFTVIETMMCLSLVSTVLMIVALAFSWALSFQRSVVTEVTDTLVANQAIDRFVQDVRAHQSFEKIEENNKSTALILGKSGEAHIRYELLDGKLCRFQIDAEGKKVSGNSWYFSAPVDVAFRQLGDGSVLQMELREKLENQADLISTASNSRPRVQRRMASARLAPPRQLSQEDMAEKEPSITEEK